jgi:hypothetical protein
VRFSRLAKIFGMNLAFTSGMRRLMNKWRHQFAGMLNSILHFCRRAAVSFGVAAT